MHGKLLASHVKWADWRMVTDLFIVDRDPFNAPLKSVSKDGIERLEQDKLAYWEIWEESDDAFDLNQRICICNWQKVVRD